MKFLEDIHHVHMVGIGGIGMSALAKFFRHHSISVSGSDNNISDITSDLSDNYDVCVSIGHRHENITENHNLLVFSPAIPETNSERIEARNRDISEFSYPQILGKISQEMTTIAISGTNGKTTTTSMVVELLKHLGIDPTAIVGEYLTLYNSNFISGQSEYFVTEACEYKDSFLNIHHDILVITNITEDHLDYFKDINDIQNSFTSFLNNKKNKGVLVCNIKLPELQPILEEARKNNMHIVDYGKYIDTIELSIPGDHNIYNAAAALGVIEALNVSLPDAKKYLSRNFQGAKRRMEHIGFLPSGALMFDDYAHNPEGLQSLIEGLRSFYPNKKIVVLFQPHLYSRTRSFKEAFGSILSTADIVYLFKTYRAREPELPSEDYLLEEYINKDQVDFRKVEDTKEFVENFKEQAFGSDYIVVTAGAGDIWKIGLLLKK